MGTVGIRGIACSLRAGESKHRARIGHYYMTLKGLPIPDLQWVSTCGKGIGVPGIGEKIVCGGTAGGSVRTQTKEAWSVSQRRSFASNGHSFFFNNEKVVTMISKLLS